MLGSWSIEPPIILNLILAAAIYAAGWQRLASRTRRPLLAAWRSWCYFLGLATLGLALLSPLASFDDDLLFVHMIQHLLLLVVAPPLLWLGAPLVPVLWAFPSPQRRALGRLFRKGHPVHRLFYFLTDPRVAATIYLAVVGVWHIPAFYNLAQGETTIHSLEHVLFLAAALLYWWPVVHPSGGRRRLGYGLSLVYLFVANVEGFLIGAPLTLMSQVAYAHYALAPRVMDLSPLADQHLAGLIMWVPTGLVWMAVSAIVFVRWIGTERKLSEDMFLYLSSLSRRV